MTVPTTARPFITNVISPCAPSAPPVSAVPQQTQGVAAAAPNEEALASLHR